MEPDNPLLDQYVLSLCRRKRPRVCFIPSASGDADHYVVRFYRHFHGGICEPSHISLFRRDCGPGSRARAPAGAGPDLRRRRLDPLAARGLAGARARRGPACRLAGRRDHVRRLRRLAVLVRERADRLSPRSEAICRAGLPATLQRGALRGGVRAAPGVPRRAAGRLAAGRLRRVRRRGAALRRHGPAPGRPVAPEGARLPRRGGGRPRSSSSRWRRRTSANARRSPLPPEPTIFAMGGGGFCMEPQNPALDDYILALPRRARCRRSACCRPPRATARRRSASSTRRSARARCEPMHIALFRLGIAPAAAARDAARAGRDLRRRRLDARAARRLARARAGRDPARVLGEPASCWRGCRRARCAGSSGASRRRWARPRRRPGWGCCRARCRVHCDGEPARLPVYRHAVRSGAVPPGYAADDGVGLLFRGDGAAGGRQLAPARARALRVTPGAEAPVQARRLTVREQFGDAPDIAEFRRMRALRNG